MNTIMLVSVVFDPKVQNRLSYCLKFALNHWTFVNLGLRTALQRYVTFGKPFIFVFCDSSLSL